MEKTESNDALREFFEKIGIKPGQEYRFVFTKELKIEPVTKALDLSAILPYPLEKAGSCPICDKAFAQHGFMPYFTDPKHIKSVRDFVIALRAKLDVTKNMPLKLAVEAPSSVLNPKEIVNRIFVLLREAQGENLANHFIRVVSHYTPSESIRYAIETGRGSLAQKLFQVERHYEARCREWRVELQVHKELSAPYLGFIAGEEEKTKATFNLVEFAEKHEAEVESHYFDIQSGFHGVTARILAYENMVKEFTKVSPYDKMRLAVAKRPEKRPIVLSDTLGLTGLPGRRRRQSIL